MIIVHVALRRTMWDIFPGHVHLSIKTVWSTIENLMIKSKNRLLLKWLTTLVVQILFLIFIEYIIYLSIQVHVIEQG